MKGPFPLLGGLLLLGAFVFASISYASPDYGSTVIFGIGGVFVLGIGSLLLGVVLMVICRITNPAFFKGETLRRGTPAERVDA